MAAITLRNPRSGGWKAFFPKIQLFGSTTAGLEYNCLSRIIATLATRLAGIPTLGYFDDFGLVSPLPLTEEILLAFTELNEISGFALNEISECLGFIFDVSPLPVARRSCIFLNLRKTSSKLRFVRRLE